MAADKMICASCYEEITPENNGIEVSVGYQEFVYQCEDCHEIEFGTRIYAMNLVFNNIFNEK